jgi:hypothetical protein
MRAVRVASRGAAMARRRSIRPMSSGGRPLARSTSAPIRSASRSASGPGRPSPRRERCPTSCASAAASSSGSRSSARPRVTNTEPSRKANAAGSSSPSTRTVRCAQSQPRAMRASAPSARAYAGPASAGGSTPPWRALQARHAGAGPVGTDAQATVRSSGSSESAGRTRLARCKRRAAPEPHASALRGARAHCRIRAAHGAGKRLCRSLLTRSANRCEPIEKSVPAAAQLVR